MVGSGSGVVIGTGDSGLEGGLESGNLMPRIHAGFSNVNDVYTNSPASFPAS